MEEIKFTNLIKKELLDLAIRPYITDEVIEAIKLEVQPNSGFGYFLWGYCLELGLKNFQKDYKKSL